METTKPFDYFLCIKLISKYILFKWKWNVDFPTKISNSKCDEFIRISCNRFTCGWTCTIEIAEVYFFLSFEIRLLRKINIFFYFHFLFTGIEWELTKRYKRNEKWAKCKRIQLKLRFWFARTKIKCLRFFIWFLSVAGKEKQKKNAKRFWKIVEGARAQKENLLCVSKSR